MKTNVFLILKLAAATIYFSICNMNWLEHPKAPIVFFSLVALLCFSSLGSTSVYILDEAKNATAAYEMWKNGEWILPTFNGLPRYDKPPLHYYFFGLSYSIFGVNSFAARFFSALASFITLLFLFDFASKKFNKRVGYLTVLLLVSSIHWAIQFHLSVPDPFLICGLTLAVIQLMNYQSSGHSTKWNLWLAGLFIGLATLSKGPIALILIGGSLFLYFLLDRKQFFKNCFLYLNPIFIAIILAIALPWYVLVYLKTSGRWLEEFFWRHNVERFNGPMEGHGGTFLLPALIVIIAFFPLIGIVFNLFSRKISWQNIPNSIQYGLMFSFFTLLFFSLSGTKLPNYIVPAYPFVALFLAWYLDKLAISKIRIPLFVGIMVLASLPIVLQFFPMDSMEFKLISNELPLLYLLWIPLFLGLLFLWIRKNNLALGALFASQILLQLVVFFVLFPKIDAYNPVIRSTPYWKHSSNLYYYQRFNPAFPFAFQKQIEELPLPGKKGMVVITTSTYLGELDQKGISYAVLFSGKDLFEKTETVILKIL